MGKFVVIVPEGTLAEGFVQVWTIQLILEFPVRITKLGCIDKSFSILERFNTINAAPLADSYLCKLRTVQGPDYSVCGGR